MQARSGFDRYTRTAWFVPGLLAALLLAGCSPAPADSVTIRIDGKQMVFHAPSLVVHGVSGKREAFSLVAYTQTGKQPSFDIDLQLPGAQIGEVSYSARELASHEARAGVGQSDSLSLQFIPGGGQGVYWSQNGGPGDAGDFVLEITSLTDARMSARFSGPLEENGRVVQVSGTFDLPYEYVAQAGW